MIPFPISGITYKLLIFIGKFFNLRLVRRIVRDQDVDKCSIEPRIVERHCGGWLAVSNRADPLKIGVVALSAAQAEAEFWAAHDRILRWIAADALAAASSANATVAASP